MSINSALTGAALRRIMRDSADQIGPGSYDAAGHDDRDGLAPVKARQVRPAGRAVGVSFISLLIFNDMPEGELAARAAT